jgi:integrase/recombinase XerC
MELHVSTYDGRIAFLFVDEQERVVEYPTEFMRSLGLAPRNYPDGTLERYAEKIRDLGAFIESDQVLGQVRVDDAFATMTRLHVSAFYKSLQDAGLKPATVRLAESAVRRFTQWMSTDEAKYMHRRELFPKGSTLLTPPPQNRQPRYLTHRQVIAVSQALRFEAQRLAVHFMFDTGLRVSEVPRVLLSDLPDWHHYPEGQMYFPLVVRGSKARGRDFKTRMTIISRPLLSRLARHHNTPAYRFNLDFEESQRPALLNVFGDAWTADAVEALIRKAATKAKIKASAHKLRHGTAFSILNSEHGRSFMDNLVILQRVLGHADISTTEIYTHIPAALLQRVCGNYGQPEFSARYEEAQAIFDATYLTEKRQPVARRIGSKR